MQLRQIEMVRENFVRIAPHADDLATHFYNRLFTIDSSLRPMLEDDLTEQKQKLIMMLEFAVETLDRIEVFTPSLENLGRKNFDYGVRDEHYDAVGAAFFLTLRQMLGAEFTTEVETAWLETYWLVSGIMRRAGQQSIEVAA